MNMKEEKRLAPRRRGRRASERGTYIDPSSLVGAAPACGLQGGGLRGIGACFKVSAKERAGEQTREFGTRKRRQVRGAVM